MLKRTLLWTICGATAVLVLGAGPAAAFQDCGFGPTFREVAPGVFLRDTALFCAPGRDGRVERLERRVAELEAALHAAPPARPTLEPKARPAPSPKVYSAPGPTGKKPTWRTPWLYSNR